MTMIPFSRTLLLAGALILLVSSPACATQILTSESFTPNPPFVAGSSQHAVIQYAIASGTTFPKDHELQMQTSLEKAQWTIQVIVDGNNAARQTASGSAIFLSGELLSYSVNHDVGFTVTIDGTVPTAGSTVTVLDLVEIDNTNNIVPGSESVISQPVGSGSVPAVMTSSPAVPTLTPPLVTTTPAAHSPGFSAAPGMAACGLAVCLILWRRRS